MASEQFEWKQWYLLHVSKSSNKKTHHMSTQPKESSISKSKYPAIKLLPGPNYNKSLKCCVAKKPSLQSFCNLLHSFRIISLWYLNQNEKDVFLVVFWIFRQNTEMQLTQYHIQATVHASIIQTFSRNMYIGILCYFLHMKVFPIAGSSGVYL